MWILPDGFLKCSAKLMLFQPPIYHQNKGERFCFYPVISMYIYLYYLYSLCMCVSYLSIFIYEYMAYSRQWGHRCIIWGTVFGKKEIFLAVANAPMADMNIKVPVNLKLQPRRHTDTHTDIFTSIHLMYLMIHFLCRKFKKKNSIW